MAEQFRVIVVDWPGYGSSPALAPDKLSAMAYADALEDVVEGLGAVNSVGLIGNSVGGYAATRFAARWPGRVAGLVLVNTGGFTRHNRLSRAFCRIQGREWVSRWGSRRLAGHYLRVRTPTVVGMLARAAAGRRNRQASRVSAAIWQSFADPEHDLRASVGAITAPTLLVWGRHDFLLPLARDGREAERCIPGAKLVAFETGHAPFAEAPEAFLGAVLPFLQRHLR